MTLPHKAPRIKEKNLQAEMLVCMANEIKIKDDIEEVILSDLADIFTTRLVGNHCATKNRRNMQLVSGTILALK